MSRLQQQQIQTKHKKSVKRKHGKNDRQKMRGPRLPYSLRRELRLENRPHTSSRGKQASGEGEEEEEEEAEATLKVPTSDIYEYEEDEAPEDLRKNRRFDDVDRLEYELPSDFEDEEIDENAADGEDRGGLNKRTKQQKSFAFGKSNQARKLQIDDKEASDEDSAEESDDLDLDREDEDDFKDGAIDSDGFNTSEHVLKEEKDEDESDGGSSDNGSVQSWDGDVDKTEDDNDVKDNDERHQRMLAAVRSLRKKEPRERKPKRMEVVSEAYPESEFNINPSTDDKSSKLITIEDLMAPLQSSTGFGSLRKRMHQLEKRRAAVDVPLPKVVQERLTRKAGYEKSNEELSKWQDLVKTNREAPSLVFTQRPELTATSTAELVSKFEPRTELEKDVASLLKENGLIEDTLEATTGLAFNKLTMDEVKERQERLAKMRSILSHHEAKAKRIKKIKSKAYHRLLQKDRRGKVGQDGELDEESLKEAAMKAEFKRVQERMTLKHKNTSRWAKRIIKRGLKARQDGSREALAEQLHTHIALTRKIKSVDKANSSDDSSGNSDTDSGSMEEGSGLSQLTKSKSKMLAKAKVETLKVLEGDAEAEIPKSGLFALPFMARAIEKKRKQAQSEAMAVLEQLEQLEYGNDNGVKDFDDAFEAETPMIASAGRLAFGDVAKSMSYGKEQEPDMLVEDGSSSEDNGHDQDLVKAAGEKTAPTSSKKRKTKGSKNLDRRNGFESQEYNFHIADGAWTDDGIVRATALTVSGPNCNEDVGNLREVCASNNLKVEIDNPWLYGIESKKAGITAQGMEGEKQDMKDKDAGPLVASASFELVSIAGVDEKEKRKMESPKNILISDLAIADDAGQARSLTSSDCEKEDNEDYNVEEQNCHFLLENASQAELIQRAFAGDDVEADFEQLKSDAINEEVPLGETALSLPGWGQWTDVQKKKGPPSWMVKQQEELKRNREQALNKRKDSKLRHVIISERMDKKAEKFMLPTLPFPFRSKGVFEKSIRMPIGREFNTDQAFRDMIRPMVVKDAGVIIAPIKYKMSDDKNADAILHAKDKMENKSKESSSKRKREQTKRFSVTS